MAENNQRKGKESVDTEPSKRPAHLWKPGQSGNPNGRKPGSRVKLEEVFVRDMVEAWEVHGKKALETVAEKEPAKFAQIAASILPKHQTITRKVEQMSDRELADLLATMNSKVSDNLSQGLKH